MDAAIRTAYATDWIRPGSIPPDGNRLGDFYCAYEACARLPSESMVVGYAALSVFSVIAFAGALELWLRRTRESFRQADRSAAVGRIWSFASTIIGFVVVLAVAGGLLRYRAARGVGSALISRATLLTMLSLAALLIAALTIGNMAMHNSGSVQAGVGLTRRLGDMLRRQRINLLGTIGYVLIILVVNQSSGQALDALRGWDLSSASSRSAVAFGMASTVLFALVLYESALRLSQARRESESRSGLKASHWLMWGLAVLAIGVVGAVAGGVGWGIATAGVLVLGLALAEHLDLPCLYAEPNRVQHVPTMTGQAHCELLAIVPLITVSIGTFVGGLDAALAPEVTRDMFVPLIPGLMLAILAIFMTQREASLELTHPSRHVWIGMAALTSSVAFSLAFLVRRTPVTAVIGFVFLMLVVAYVFVLFYGRHIRRSYGLALPFAIAAGLATLFAIHVDVHATARVLGTVSIVNIALASLLNASWEFMLHG